MRSTRARVLLENLEKRALLTTSIGFNDDLVQVVSDKEFVFLMGSSGGAFSKTIPLKSAIYDPTSDTVYLVPVSKVKRSLFFEVEPPFVNQANLQAINAKPTNEPLINEGFSNLTDTSGNPIASFPGSNLFSTDGNFFAPTQITKASPAVLSYLFGTPTPATPKVKPRLTHKAK